MLTKRPRMLSMGDVELVGVSVAHFYRLCGDREKSRRVPSRRSGAGCLQPLSRGRRTWRFMHWKYVQSRGHASYQRMKARTGP